MATPTDLVPIIESIAAGPAAASSDAGSMTAQSPTVVIQVEQYTNAKAARGNKRRGLMHNKIIPAGPFSDRQGTNPRSDC